MKNILKYFSILALGGVLLLTTTGCYRDHSNENLTDVPSFFVDTTGVTTTIRRQQFEPLQLSPTVVFEGNRGDLAFVWKVYREDPGMTGNPADTIATTESLYISAITLQPDTYTIEFRAIDRITGRIAVLLYTLVIEGNAGTGLMVLHDIDGRVEICILRLTHLQGLVTESSVARNLFSLANPNFNSGGGAVGLGMYSSGSLNMIHLLTEGNIARLSPIDLLVIEEVNQLLAPAPTAVRPQRYFGPRYDGALNSLGNALIINDGRVHPNPILMANLLAGDLNPPFGSVLELVSDGTQYVAAPWVAFGSGNYIIYDQLGMRFLTLGSMAVELAPVTYTAAAINAKFDLRNIGKTMLYMTYGFGAAAVPALGRINYAVFRSPVDDGQRWLYIIDFSSGLQTFRSVTKFDISSAPHIADALHFVVGSRGPTFFYATENRIFQIRYQWDAPDDQIQDVIEVWPNIPAGEIITHIQLSSTVGLDLPGQNVFETYMFIATYNQSTGEGKIYMLEMHPTSGVLTDTPVAVFEGFGRIRDLEFKPR